MKYPNLIFMFRQIKIINGQFPVISRKSSHSLTCISVYCHHIRICYHICCIKRCYKKPRKMTKRGIHISWGTKQGIKLQGRSNNPFLFIMGYLTSRSWKYLISTKGGTLYSLPNQQREEHCIHYPVDSETNRRDKTGGYVMWAVGQAVAQVQG